MIACATPFKISIIELEFSASVSLNYILDAFW